jgi:hypothetical protein
MAFTNGTMQLKVDLGPMPVDQMSGGATEGGALRGLLDRHEFCDVVLVAGGKSFSAHSLVLAAVSAGFHEQIQQEYAKGVPGFVAGLDRQPVTIHLGNVSHPEAVQDMLDCIYGPYVVDSREPHSKTELANRDVLQLAQSYQIPPLTHQASLWLAQNLTTQNVLGRLAICEEFGLLEVREKILEQLIADPVALPMLARDPEVTKVPKVLQDLLVRILTLVTANGMDAHPQQGSVGQGKTNGKHARKAGA